jgi:hypothetical protein
MKTLVWESKFTGTETQEQEGHSETQAGQQGIRILDHRFWTHVIVKLDENVLQCGAKTRLS